MDGDLSDKAFDMVDKALDPMMISQNSSTDLVFDKPLISVEDAQAKLSTNILKILSEKFNGSLTHVRYKDERDQIFL